MISERSGDSSGKARELTYEIVGAPERFDERDSVFARERLVPGSLEEQLYHAQNPDKIEVDRKLRAFIEGKADPDGQSEEEDDWRLSAFYQATFGPVAGISVPDMVDGPPSAVRIEMSEETAAERIKCMAAYLGADRSAIGPLNPAWVYSHRGAPPFFEGYVARLPFYTGIPDHYTDIKWGEPISLPHRYGIAMAFAQDPDHMRSFPSPASDLEVGRVYAKGALAAVQLARFIRSLGYPARAHHLRNSAVILPAVAADAGLGELSRAGYLLIKGLGLNTRLSCVTTDLPMTMDPPVDLGIQDFCEKCQKCAHCCPASCIPEGGKTDVRGVRKWRIDEEKCLLYWGRIGVACGICQVVCPWSKPETWCHKLIAEIAIRAPWSRRALVWADDLVYGRGYRRKREPQWTAR